MLAWLTQPSPRGSEHASIPTGSEDYAYSASISDAESMPPSLHAWLESTKPGYGEKFLPAFTAVGVEDIFDLPNIDHEIFLAVKHELEHLCGAKRMHLKNIHAALVAAGMPEDVAPDSWRSPRVSPASSPSKKDKAPPAVKKSSSLNKLSSKAAGSSPS